MNYTIYYVDKTTKKEYEFYDSNLEVIKCKVKSLKRDPTKLITLISGLSMTELEYILN